MANDSSTGGFISPAGSSAPLQDDALADFLQELVVGITGLPADLVRPRWQSTVPKQPEATVDWCAIGVTSIEGDDYPAEVHDGTDDGSSRFEKHETLNLLASFYGPHAQGNAGMLRDGLYIAQNREAMAAQNMNLTDAAGITAAPDLINQRWVRRYDLPIRFRRKVERVYPILNILSASIDTETDAHP